MTQPPTLLRRLIALPPQQRQTILASLSPEVTRALQYAWRSLWARPNQLAPGSPGSDGAVDCDGHPAAHRTDWNAWLLQAGRGFGKTRTGAEWSNESAMRAVTIGHLVAATAADARDVMVNGPAGILATAQPGQVPRYSPSKRLLRWPNGSTALLFSADEPKRLRGPQCHWYWADELASWRYADAWDQLQFGARLGDHPQGVVTTTPRPMPALKALRADSGTVITRGSTYDNAANLAQSFLDTVVRRYEGTFLGAQELHAEDLGEAEGAMWRRAQLELLRVRLADLPPMIRVVVAIDPAVSSGGSSAETGIVVAGLAKNGHGYVLDDLSGQLAPDLWAARAVAAYHDHEADRIVAEANNGGDLVEHTIRTLGPEAANLPYRAVHASQGKRARAEPVAALYAQGRVHHVGMFGALEDQLCTWEPLSGQPSPDRLDACVWALSALMLDAAPPGPPRVGGQRRSGR